MAEKYLSEKEVNYQEFGPENVQRIDIRAYRSFLRRFFNTRKYKLSDSDINRIKSHKYPRKYYYEQQVLQVFELIFGFCAVFLGVWLILIFNSQLSAFTDFKELSNLLALGYPILIFSSMVAGGGLAVGIIWFLYSKLPDPILRDYILRKNMTHNWYGSFKSFYSIGLKVGIVGLILCASVFCIWLLASVIIGY